MERYVGHRRRSVGSLSLSLSPSLSLPSHSRVLPQSRGTVQYSTVQSRRGRGTASLHIHEMEAKETPLH